MNYKRPKTDTSIDYKNVYNTTKWRKLRKSVLLDNPLCVGCKKELAKDCHHIIPFSDSFHQDKDLYFDLAFTYDNIAALCKECHRSVHNENSLTSVECEILEIEYTEKEEVTEKIKELRKMTKIPVSKKRKFLENL